MTAPIEAEEGVVPVSYHTFWLADTAVPGPTLPYDDTNGLIVAQPGIALVFTGIHTGGVNVRVEVFDDAPLLNTADWDEVVEVSIESTEGRIVVTGMHADAPDNLPVLTPDGEGWYRLRIHARGRDTAVDLSPPQPVEDYLIQVWPTAEEQPENAYKHTDGYGASKRAK
ncbi:hypothetical protein [Lentzea sp. NPDC004782]|uniref:hypothetical protein n=1 Tax=Lentzea sp. NPDC004782 TaxID=3154458 RepID=UPI0033B726F6